MADEPAGQPDADAAEELPSTSPSVEQVPSQAGVVDADGFVRPRAPPPRITPAQSDLSTSRGGRDDSGCGGGLSAQPASPVPDVSFTVTGAREARARADRAEAKERLHVGVGSGAGSGAGAGAGAGGSLVKISRVDDTGAAGAAGSAAGQAGTAAGAAGATGLGGVSGDSRGSASGGGFGGALGVPGLSLQPSLVPRERRKVPLPPGHTLTDWLRQSSVRPHPTSAPSLTLAEIARHNTAADCWIVLHKRVYDVTQYLSYHPGGGPELMRAAGRDGTDLFQAMHGFVNFERLLEKYLVGIVDTSGGGAASASASASGSASGGADTGT